MQIDWLAPGDWIIKPPKTKKASTMSVTIAYIRARHDGEDDLPVVRYLPVSLINQIREQPSDFRISPRSFSYKAKLIRATATQGWRTHVLWKTIMEFEVHNVR